jgi:hypothetical protein
MFTSGMSKENKTTQTDSHPPLSGVIPCAFVALADRHGSENYEEFDSKEEAVRFLEYGSDEGMHMDIAVIDCSTNEMVWHEDYLGEKECQERVNRFIAKHSLQRLRLCAVADLKHKT